MNEKMKVLNKYMLPKDPARFNWMAYVCIGLTVLAFIFLILGNHLVTDLIFVVYAIIMLAYIFLTNVYEVDTDIEVMQVIFESEEARLEAQKDYLFVFREGDIWNVIKKTDLGLFLDSTFDKL